MSTSRPAPDAVAPAGATGAAAPATPAPATLPPTSDLTTPPSAPMMNATTTTQLAHRTIRAYTDEPVAPEVMETLLQVARRTATSQYQQQLTIIRVTDPAVRAQLHAVSGQPYVGGSRGELLVLVADLHRNAVIRERAGADLEPLERTNLFLQAAQDTLLAAQNMVVAAESLGLGTCYLGSLLADPQRVIDVLHLPERTFPLLGLLLGHPAQEPQFKPRLPLEVVVGEDSYPRMEEHEEALAAYDEEVGRYYDLRDTSRRVDSFTHQVATALGRGGASTSPLLEVLHRQRLCLR